MPLGSNSSHLAMGRQSNAKAKGFYAGRAGGRGHDSGNLSGRGGAKLLGTSTTASENGLKQTLAVVRDAIERYAADNGGQLPPNDTEGNFTNALTAKYLRGTFPICPVGNKNGGINLVAGGGPIVVGDVTGTKGWAYCKGSGEFVCNSTAASPNDPSGPKYWQW